MDDVWWVLESLFDPARFLPVLLGDDERVRFDQAGTVNQLLLLEPPVQRRNEEADLRCGEVRFDVLPPILREDRHPGLRLLVAPFQKRVRQCVDPLVELGVRHLPPGFAHRHVVGVHPSGFPHQIADVELSGSVDERLLILYPEVEIEIHACLSL